MESTFFKKAQLGYENGFYTLRELVEFVDKKMITEEEFHWITNYSYQGIKKTRGW